MPSAQVAQRSAYPFGANGTGNPVIANTVLTFKCNRGWRDVIGFKAFDKALTITVKVSPDNTTYSATTTTNNISAITNFLLNAGARQQFDFLIRENTDLYFTVWATGNGGGEFYVGAPDSESMDIVKI